MARGLNLDENNEGALRLAVAENARLREALEPFADALRSARGRLGDRPSRADVVAIACRHISYDHLKAALSEVAQGQSK